jgi:hypothetical protein
MKTTRMKTMWAVLHASGERVSHGSPSTRANPSSSAGGIGTPILHCANQTHERFDISNLCARSTLLRYRRSRRQHCHGEAKTSLRSSSKNHLVQAGTQGNATIAGASPHMNLLRNNDGHGWTLRSRWQLDARDKNKCKFRDDRETGTTRDCRRG